MCFEGGQQQFPLHIFDRKPLVRQFNPQVAQSLAAGLETIGQIVEANEGGARRARGADD